nr:sugar phosphate isomerase/epimerase family protein [Sedimentibacter sp.]
MFKTGIFHWYGYILQPRERIKLIQEAGYDYIMLWWEDESYPDFVDRRELINIVRDNGLELDNIHLPYDDINMLWSNNGIDRRCHTDKIIKWMNECKNSGADMIVMHTNHGDNYNFEYADGYESFNKIVKCAEDIRLKVAFENTQMFHYTDFILKEFDSEYSGFCYDSSHDFVNGQSFGEILDKWKHKLLCVHLSDNDGTCDRHWIPTKGHVNWKRIINIIKQTNCKSFSMETYPFEEEKKLEPIEFLIKAKKSLISIL